MKSPTPNAEDDFRNTLAFATDDESRRLRSGVSMYRLLSQAKAKARAIAWLGAWVAEVNVEGLEIERSTKSNGHFTVWGSPTMLSERVIAIHEVYE